ncbi:hypothetical protein [Akkermansia muciniphila]|uniref:hypothetical protein n=1 Tax=Akkermansia muciniphila TaxID=239935 RepID=UPI000CC8902B|nr:hypothetical protein [Akkermansia muciniphila]PNC05355.1 hypothetical protein CXU21_09475 [Akkermansia muciniphila]
MRERLLDGIFMPEPEGVQFASSSTGDSIFYRVIPGRGSLHEERRTLQIVVTDGLPWTNLALSSHDCHA